MRSRLDEQSLAAWQSEAKAHKRGPIHASNLENPMEAAVQLDPDKERQALAQALIDASQGVLVEVRSDVRSATALQSRLGVNLDVTVTVWNRGDVTLRIHNADAPTALRIATLLGEVLG